MEPWPSDPYSCLTWPFRSLLVPCCGFWLNARTPDRAVDVWQCDGHGEKILMICLEAAEVLISLIPDAVPALGLEEHQKDATLLGEPVPVPLLEPSVMAEFAFAPALIAIGAAIVAAETAPDSSALAAPA